MIADQSMIIFMSTEEKNGLSHAIVESVNFDLMSIVIIIIFCMKKNLSHVIIVTWWWSDWVDNYYGHCYVLRHTDDPIESVDDVNRW